MTCYLTIDCGTTNSRVYLVDQNGRVIGKATKGVGVRDTSIRGSNEYLRQSLAEMIAHLRKEYPQASPIKAILSSGMIGSEIGLQELPHLEAPCGLVQLAQGLTRVAGLSLTPDDIPFYIVRGIKEPLTESRGAWEQLKKADFMRGEETQIMGLLEGGRLTLPALVLVLSSHSKWIPVDGQGKILGSLTTASGQLYAAVLERSFVGKSVTKGEGDPEEPEGYFNGNLVRKAMELAEEGGVSRGMMYPRFLDVLFESRWYERRLFFEAVVAADDLRTITELSRSSEAGQGDIYLMGQQERCRLYEFLLRERFPHRKITIFSLGEEIDRFSIDGVLAIGRRAGVVI